MWRILILDDERAMLNSLHRALRKALPADCVEIELFSDPEAALLRVAERDFDVVMSDYRMPGLNGGDVLGLLKQMRPSTTRIVLSASVAQVDITDAIMRGEVFRYLTKPWDHDELIAVIHAGFERSRLASLDATRVLPSRVELETKRLEHEEPGITHVTRDGHGNIQLF